MAGMRFTGAAGTPRLVERLEPDGRALILEDRLEQREQLVAMGLARSRLVELGTRQLGRVTERGAELGPEVFLSGRDHDVGAVGAAERLPRRDEGVGRAPGLLVDAGVQEERAHVREHLDHHVEHRYVEVLAPCRLTLAFDTGEDRDRREHSSEQVCDRDAHDHRWPPGFPHDRHVSGHRLEDQVVRREVAVGALLPEARDRDQHDTGVHRSHTIEAHAEAVDHARSEVLDDGVGGSGSGRTAPRDRRRSSGRAPRCACSCCA